jgi:hypothetical protein
MRLYERFSAVNFVCCAVPTVEERTFGAVELFVECGVGALEELKFFESVGVTIEKTGVRLEVFWTTDDA